MFLASHLLFSSGFGKLFLTALHYTQDIFDRKVDSGKLTKVFRQCEWSVWVVSVSVDIFYPVLRRFKERLLREVLDVTVDGRLGQSDFRGDFSDRFPLLV